MLYADTLSRPNVPVNVLVSLEFLKAAHGWSDEEMDNLFCYNVQVRYALGYRHRGEGYFGLRTLYNFRQRLARHMQETGENLLEQAFEQVTEVQLEAFALKSGQQRRFTWQELRRTECRRRAKSSGKGARPASSSGSHGEQSEASFRRWKSAGARALSGGVYGEGVAAVVNIRRLLRAIQEGYRPNKAQPEQAGGARRQNKAREQGLFSFVRGPWRALTAFQPQQPRPLPVFCAWWCSFCSGVMFTNTK